MTTRTIDITPTWAGSLPVLLMAYEHGTPKGRQLAIEELTRMARLADERVATRTQVDAVNDAIAAEAAEIAGLKRGASIGTINSDSARVEQALAWVANYDRWLDAQEFCPMGEDYDSLHHAMLSVLRDGVSPKVGR